jgi:hypothetical protein
MFPEYVPAALAFNRTLIIVAATVPDVGVNDIACEVTT